MTMHPHPEYPLLLNAIREVLPAHMHVISRPSHPGMHQVYVADLLPPELVVTLHADEILTMADLIRDQSLLSYASSDMALITGVMRAYLFLTGTVL